MKTVGQNEEVDETINFRDVAQGLKCWKQCKSDEESVFVGYVKIRVEISNESNQLLERYGKFLLELFGVESIFAENSNIGYINNFYMYSRPYNRVYVFTVIVGDVPTTEDTQNFLDDCVTLNTYSTYFTSRTGFEDIQIVCGMKSYDSRFEMSLNCKKDIVEKQVQFKASLAIDELMKNNTDAEKDLKDVPAQSQDGFYPYDFTFTQLKKNLEKYV